MKLLTAILFLPWLCTAADMITSSGNVTMSGAITVSKYVTPTAVAPTFSPDGGDTGQAVTIATTSTGATVVASTNDFATSVTGTTSVSLTPVYEHVIKAYVTNGGFLASATATSGSYTNPVCDTIVQEQLVSSDGFSMNAANKLYTAYSFTTTSTFTICQCSMYIYKVGSPVNNCRVSIYSNNAGTPGTKLTESDAVAETSMSELSLVTFTGMHYTLSTSVKYWIVVGLDNFTGASDYIQPQNAMAGDDAVYYSTDGSTWNLLYATDTEGRFKLYGY